MTDFTNPLRKSSASSHDLKCYSKEEGVKEKKKRVKEEQRQIPQTKSENKIEDEISAPLRKRITRDFLNLKEERKKERKKEIENGVFNNIWEEGKHESTSLLSLKSECENERETILTGTHFSTSYYEIPIESEEVLCPLEK
jgi:hypothetical protein